MIVIPLIGIIIVFLFIQIIQLKRDVEKLKVLFSKLSDPVVESGNDEPDRTDDSVHGKTETFFNNDIPASPKVPNNTENELPAIVFSDTEKQKTVNPLRVLGKKVSWKKFEEGFLENWTGITGALIFVIGAGFLGKFAMKNMTEQQRFFLLLGTAAIPGILYFALKNNEKWRRVAYLFRSLSGAIVLLACLGSGSIDGLIWMRDPFYHLGLLFLGILVNLYLAVIGKMQVTASFHLVICLIALSIVPPSVSSMVMALSIGVFGISQTWKRKWDYHLLLVVCGFFLFHLFWFYTVQKDGLSNYENLLGSFAIFVIAIAAAVPHYRKAYETDRFEKLAFSVHLLNWFYLISGLILHGTQSEWKSYALFFVSIIAFILSRLAKKRGLKWLAVSDLLMGQMAVLAAIGSIMDWEILKVPILSLLSVEIMIFVQMMAWEKERFLFKLGTFLYQATVLTLIGVALTTEWSVAIRYYFMFSSVAFLFHYISLRRHFNKSFLLDDQFLGIRWIRNKEFSMSGLISCILMSFSLFEAVQLDLVLLTVIVPAVFLVLYLRHPSRGFTIGLNVLIAAFFFVNVMQIIGVQFFENTTRLQEILYYGLPIFTVVLTILFLSIKKTIPNSFIILVNYCFVIHLLVLTDYINNWNYPWLIGPDWLVLSLFMLLLSILAARFLDEEKLKVTNWDLHFRRGGYIVLLFFIIRFFGIPNIYSNRDFDGIKNGINYRYIIIALSVVVWGIWVWVLGRKKHIQNRITRSTQPWLMEIALLFFTAVIVFDINARWRPLYLAISAVLLYFQRFFKNPDFMRLQFHSLVFFWLSTIWLSIISKVYSNAAWLPIVGLLTLLVQVFFLTFQMLYNRIDSPKFPDKARILNWLVNWVYKKKHAFLFYPMSIGMAFFFHSFFTDTLLTLMWSLECFSLFAVSLLVGEMHFRYVSQGTLLICLVRLIIVDMATSNILYKALVFLGVGIVMLIMNLMFNQFKGRFKQLGTNGDLKKQKKYV